jgi:antitoxin CcdA
VNRTPARLTGPAQRVRASERGVREAGEARMWADRHADFIADMNARIECDGLPLDAYRLC